MSITIDNDVERAAELLQAAFPANRLSSIARELAVIAPLLWGRHGREQVAPAVLLSQDRAEFERANAKG